MQIEELKEKHDQAEMQIAAYEEDLTAQKELIEEQHRTIQHL
jgi:peptidoglycan hydrolase CwlO-like protein